jgi:pimeloyl-ACP methyl ester carboxylesterase
MGEPGIEERWIDVGGIRTRYQTGGRGGPPIVFVHGGTIGDAAAASSSDDFKPVLGVMAAQRTVIAVDRLGQGYTDNPPDDDETGWTMKGSVAHFIAFLETLGLGPYHLVGHSRGGYVVTRTTLERPDLVVSLTIGDSNTVAPGGARNEGIHARNPHPPGSREALVYSNQHYSYAPEATPEELIDGKLRILALEKTRKAIAKMVGQGLRAKRFLPDLAADREELFMRLAHQPLARRVLILWAYNDPTAPLDMAYNLLELIAKHQPRTSLHIVNQSGHSLYRERRPQFVRVLNEHLDGVHDGN